MQQAQNPSRKVCRGCRPPPRNTTTHSLPFRSSLLAAIETSLPGPGPRRASWWPSSLLSRLPEASPLLGIGPVQDAEGHWALVAEPGTDRQRALPRPCGSNLLLSTVRRALGATQTSAPRNTYEPTPAPATLGRRIRQLSELPRRPHDRGKRGS